MGALLGAHHPGGRSPRARGPPEYVILRKLSFYQEGGSEKHVRDIRGVLALANPPIDRDLLLRRLAEAGLSDLFQRLFP
jgi:hypothetical protein